MLHAPAPAPAPYQGRQRYEGCTFKCKSRHQYAEHTQCPRPTIYTTCHPHEDATKPTPTPEPNPET